MVVAVAAIDRAEDGEPVGDARMQRQMLAEPYARQLRGDRIEGAARFDGGIRLGVPRVEVAWSAGQPEEDYRLAVRLLRGSCLGPEAQHVRQGEAGDARQPGLYEPAP